MSESALFKRVILETSPSRKLLHSVDPARLPFATWRITSHPEVILR